MIKKVTISEQAPTTDSQSPATIIFDLLGVFLIKKTAADIALNPSDQNIQVFNTKEAYNLLKLCKEQGHRLLALSNLSAERYESIKDNPEIASLFSFFDDIIISGHLDGLKKPHPDIFSHAILKHALSPEQAIFIDDKQDNLTGAHQVGITQTILCNHFDLQTVYKKLIVFGALPPSCTLQKKASHPL